MLLEAIRWEKDKIVFIDQTELPERLRYIKCRDIGTLCEAIKRLRIRGAPLIGVAVSLGFALSAINSKRKTLNGLKRDLREASRKLRKTRPTAVNLFWALKRMNDAFYCLSRSHDIRKIKKGILKEALSILSEDRDMCRAIGRNGARLIKNRDIILTQLQLHRFIMM